MVIEVEYLSIDDSIAANNFIEAIKKLIEKIGSVTKQGNEIKSLVDNGGLIKSLIDPLVGITKNFFARTGDYIKSFATKKTMAGVANVGSQASREITSCRGTGQTGRPGGIGTTAYLCRQRIG